MNATKRREELDLLRGFTLVNMIAYHACWDLCYLFGVSMPWYRSTGAFLWQQYICWSFILLSGYCMRLGRHAVRRGLTVFGAGLLISAATYIFMPESSIFFGVLSLIGSAMLITAALRKLLEKVPAKLALPLCMLLFFMSYHASRGTLCFGTLTLPSGLYANYFSACFGFPFAGFHSADYFPLLPWLFLFFAGFYLYSLFPKAMERPPHCAPLARLGRHSLAVYLVHQPLIYGLLYLIFQL